MQKAYFCLAEKRCDRLEQKNTQAIVQSSEVAAVVPDVGQVSLIRSSAIGCAILNLNATTQTAQVKRSTLEQP